MVRRQARRVPDRRPADGRGRLRAVEARAHGVRHQRPRPPARRRRARRRRGDGRRARHARGAGDVRRRRAREGHPGGRPRRRAGGADPAPAAPQGGPARREGRRAASAAHAAVRRRRAHPVPPAARSRTLVVRTAAGHRRGVPLAAGAATAWCIAGPRLADGGPGAGPPALAGSDRGAVRVRDPPRERPRRAARPACIRRCCPAAGGSRSPTSGPRSRRCGGRSSSATRAGTGRASSRPAPTARSTCCSWSVSTRCATSPTRRSRMRALENVRSHGRAVARARARWSRTPTCSFPRRRSWRRTGTSPTWEGRGQRIRAGPRRGRHRAPGLGDLRRPGAGVGGDLGLRDARRAARGDGPPAGSARAPGAPRSRGPAAAARPLAEGRARAVHVPAARRRGPSVRARRRAEGGARRTSRSSRCTRTTRASARPGRRRPCDRAHRRRRGRAARPRHRARRAGAVVRAVQPARARREHAAVRGRSRSPRRSSRSMRRRRDADDGRGRGGCEA